MGVNSADSEKKKETHIEILEGEAHTELYQKDGNIYLILHYLGILLKC